MREAIICQISQDLDIEPEKSAMVLEQDQEGPGFLVMASPPRLLHINQRARELMRQLKAFEDDHTKGFATRDLLPQALLVVCAKILRVMQDRTELQDWKRFEIRYNITTPLQSVRIRGFGLPDALQQNQSRIVVLLEENRP
jgi:hypothetical protein